MVNGVVVIGMEVKELSAERQRGNALQKINGKSMKKPITIITHLLLLIYPKNKQTRALARSQNQRTMMDKLRHAKATFMHTKCTLAYAPAWEFIHFRSISDGRTVVRSFTHPRFSNRKANVECVCVCVQWKQRSTFAESAVSSQQWQRLMVIWNGAQSKQQWWIYPT